ncbi:hypothetical protein [Nocardia canadensis]|uniref:hypothetical protein n=1 Tax=Nocardia canadensis TaxID=3065238 RepID=UPI00292ED7BD|nr:hypothetical protein [Nocardia canadensis]
MNQMQRKALLVTIAGLIGFIVGIIAALLAHFGGEHITVAIRDGGIGFATASSFVLLVMAYLGAL